MDLISVYYASIRRIMTDEYVTEEFFKSFSITNDINDKVSIPFIRKWSSLYGFSYKTSVFKLIKELKCEIITIEHIKYITRLLYLNDDEKQLNDACNNKNNKFKTPNVIHIDHTNMNKFKNTGIYIWFCKDMSVKQEYVGKSTNIFNRISHHKISSRNKSDTKLYNFVREHGGCDNWEFNVLEVMPDNIPVPHQSNWLIKREKWWIERLEPKLNTAFTENPKAVSFLSYLGK